MALRNLYSKANHLILLSLFCVFIAFTFWIEPAWAAGGEQHEKVVSLLFGLFVVIVAGRLGADVAVRFKQPEVMGELVVGIILGNLSLIGIDWGDAIKSEQTLRMLGELGVVLLLFAVGLETELNHMLKVGKSALIVGIIGVVCPSLLGVGVASWFVPDARFVEHLFVGAILCATSVGITARVLAELKLLDTIESRIVLGAAVIDDVLGLLILAVVTKLVSSAASGQELEYFSILMILLKSVLFLVLAVYLGRRLVPYGFRYAGVLRAHGVLLSTALAICFGFSFLASIVGLAPIIGAFAAGLVLDPLVYMNPEKEGMNEKIDDLLKPILSLLVPLFFVLMGAQVNLSTFFNGDIIFFAVSLTLAAILGKQLCGYGVLEKGVDRVFIGLGMIPRGEVGLIFAAQGAALFIDGHAVVSETTFSVCVFMVMVTTMISPIMLTRRARSRSHS